MTRAEKVTLIRWTLAEHPGWTHEQTAQHLGMTRGALRNLLNDPDGSKQAKRRKRYQGRCVVCGAATNGSNGKAAAPRYCLEHANTNPEYLARKTVWPADALITAIREWNALYGEPPAVLDWNPNKARANGYEERALRFEDDDRWPWFTTVVHRFGSWNAGIRAAGFEPRVAGGGGNNVQRWPRRKAAA